jgi:hypothetical protein
MSVKVYLQGPNGEESPVTVTPCDPDDGTYVLTTDVLMKALVLREYRRLPGQERATFWLRIVPDNTATTTTDETHDALLLQSILDRPDGDILNIVQAAAELPGSTYDRLSKAYHEITGNDATDDEIGLPPQ